MLQTLALWGELQGGICAAKGEGYLVLQCRELEG